MYCVGCEGRNTATDQRAPGHEPSIPSRTVDADKVVCRSLPASCLYRRKRGLGYGTKPGLASLAFTRCPVMALAAPADRLRAELSLLHLVAS